jgi:hypothetical protein
MSTEAEQSAFVETFREFLNEVVFAQRSRGTMRTPLGDLVAEHLDAPIEKLPFVSESLPVHRLVDADLALEHLCGTTGRLLGVAGGQQRYHEELPQLLASPHIPFDVGPVDYISADVGPHEQRQVVAFGLRLFHVDGEPVAVLQRSARPEIGRAQAGLEVLARSPQASGAALASIRRLMRERSVLRGQVLSFTGEQFGAGAGGVTFHERPTVRADDVVLPPGTLDRVVGHVVDVGRLRQRLRASGQHLKRGVLLYGPPGTGKTLTVRHLLARSEGVTCVLLAGNSIRFITEAAELARAMQPALVVLEDVDLVAAERDRFGGPQPLLFAVLDALDGLDGDADVAFVLTTNRADLLEPALAQRPGRVDLAVEIPLPDRAARRRLFTLYADGLPFTGPAFERAAERADGVTASFAKELVRRAVLRAVQEERDVEDADLGAALDELLSPDARLTRGLLGSPGAAPGGRTQSPAGSVAL